MILFPILMNLCKSWTLNFGNKTHNWCNKQISISSWYRLRYVNRFLIFLRSSFDDTLSCDMSMTTACRTYTLDSFIFHLILKISHLNFTHNRFIDTNLDTYMGGSSSLNIQCITIDLNMYTNYNF